MKRSTAEGDRVIIGQGLEYGRRFRGDQLRGSSRLKCTAYRLLVRQVEREKQYNSVCVIVCKNDFIQTPNS